MKTYARHCDITGQGMNEGWCWGDGMFYTATEEVTIKELRKEHPQQVHLTDDDILEWAYDEEILYWTTWYDEDIFN
jgi:hypothetical protein